MNLAGHIGELRLMLEVKSAETGEVRQVEMVGFANEDQLKQLQADGLISEE